MYLYSKFVLVHASIRTRVNFYSLNPHLKFIEIFFMVKVLMRIDYKCMYGIITSIDSRTS